MRITNKLSKKKRFKVISYGIAFFSLAIPVVLGTFYVRAYVNESVSPMGCNIFCIVPGEVNQLAKGYKYDTGDSAAGTAGESMNQFVNAMVGMPYNYWRGNLGDTPTVSDYVELKEKTSPGLITTVYIASAKIIDQKPISTEQYVNQQVYALKNLGQVNAQDPGLYYPGTGFSLLKPIQSFWGWSVNIVYGLLIFVIIGIAFSIMFKDRIGGAASVTIQSAIPNIAMAMILVPLSYAICGVFIDVVTVGTNVVHEFFVGSGAPARVVYEERSQLGSGSSDAFDVVDEIPDGDPKDRGLYADDERLTWFGSGASINISDEDADQDLEANTQTFFNSLLGDTIFSVVDGALGLIFDVAGAGWTGDIIAFFLSILLLLTGLRILWRLLQKYLVFVLMPVFAPFVFATVAIPGNGTKQIMQFLKFMWSASLFYIVTYTMFLLAIIFASNSFQEAIPDLSTAMYIPPMLGIDSIVQSGGNVIASALNSFIFGLLAIMIYLNIPHTLDQIDASLGTKMVMPSFVTNAINSAKDSYNLGKQGYDNLRFKEGTYAGSLYKGGKAVANAPFSLNQARLRANQAARNALDYMRGIERGEFGSSLDARRKRLKSNIDDAERNRLAARDPIRRNFWAQQKAAAQRELDQINKAAGSPEDKGGAKKLIADISFGAQGSFITLTEGTVQEIRFQYEKRGSSVFTFKKVGKLVLKSENFALPPYMLRDVYIRETVPATPTAMSSDTQPGRIVVPPGGLDITTIPEIFSFADQDWLTVEFEPPLMSPDSGGTKYEWQFSLVIRNIEAFLNEIRPGKVAVSNEVMFGLRNPTNTGPIGPKPATRAGSVDLTSNPVKIIITTDTSLEYTPRVPGP